jgi:hypothetical protein
MMMRTHAVLTCTLAVVLLSGCAPEADAEAEPPRPTGSPTPTASATPTARPARFAQPKTCAEILPVSRLDSLAAQNLTLLGGPGGKFGDNYTADPTPERQAGGITCIWGDDATNASSLTVSVAPLSASNRAVIVSSLVSQGLNEQIVDGLTLYGQFGDENTEPAILNVLRSDSWISVISTHGGNAAYDTALTVANETALAVYLAD